jgi:hypothetical protein
MSLVAYFWLAMFTVNWYCGDSLNFDIHTCQQSNATSLICYWHPSLNWYALLPSSFGQ